jgi:hypothetical protein
MKFNPFSVQTPETMSAKDIVKLFVQAPSNMQLTSPGHLFINAHRGSGKSMALRYLSPDCQLLVQEKPLNEHPFLAIYATVKATELDLHEFTRIQDESSGVILAEHLLATFFAGKCVKCLAEVSASALATQESFDQLQKLFHDFVASPLTAEGVSADALQGMAVAASATDLLRATQSALDNVHIQTIKYLRRRGMTKDYVPYEGPLLGFRDFLFPLLGNLRRIKSLPQGPVYLIVDDADNLNLLQTLVLNTWVSYRTTDEVSLKISTQLRYKTFSTTTGNRIETPHDYGEIDAFSMFTGGSRDNYPAWLKEIVERRLGTYLGATPSAELFFPPDAAQEQAIQKIAAKYMADWDTSGSGARPRDDAYRYARPDYIRSLGGTSKISYTYRYAGFEQLVHISSGIVRHFLDAASHMYSKQAARVETVTEISPSIQDEVIRGLADDLMEKEFDKLLAESDPRTGSRFVMCSVDDLRQLKTLIKSLGGVFYEVLISDRSERRVLTFALSNTVSPRVEKIIRLGVENGYFYESFIGSKDGRSRTRRYVLTRRVAPYFKLDPTGFAGYLFVSNDLLEAAITDDVRAIELFKRKRLDDGNSQPSLFEGERNVD